MLEFQHQIQLVTHFKGHPIVGAHLFHVPNGGYRAKREASKLKAMGVRAGVSDLFLAYPSNGYHGLWLELKSRLGGLSEKQSNWLALMRGVGYCAKVSNSLELSIFIIQDYLGELVDGKRERI